MSGTATSPTPTSRRGQIVISIVTQTTFLVALIAAAYLYWVTKDPVVLAVLAGAIGVASTNATNIVGYWVGSSDGSAKKTELLAAVPPAAPPP
jgi:hypothetical protein